MGHGGRNRSGMVDKVEYSVLPFSAFIGVVKILQLFCLQRKAVSERLKNDGPHFVVRNTYTKK
jgi:hypothetical protein